MEQSNRFYDHVAWRSEQRQGPQNAPQWEVMPIEAQQPIVTIEPAAQAYEGATERTSGVDRSKALVIRLLPFTGVWLVLAVAVAMLAGSGVMGLLVFSLFTAATYAAMDRQERQFSRNGLERHKVDVLASLKRDEMRHTQELRRMALRSYLKQIEGGHNER
ncbi:MAG: hypothetical protein KDE47_13885 [Caldilineaceae bacterium]|nr:hypothetical protein [Caldilineaceae bacterium]